MPFKEGASPEQQPQEEIPDAIELTPKELEYDDAKDVIEKQYQDKKAEIVTAILGIEKLYGKKYWYLKQAVRDKGLGSKNEFEYEDAKEGDENARKGSDGKWKKLVMKSVPMTPKEIEWEKNNTAYGHGLNKEQADHVREFVRKIEESERNNEEDREKALKNALSKITE